VKKLTKKQMQMAKVICDWYFSLLSAFSEGIMGVKPMPNEPVGTIYYKDIAKYD